jgi:carbonic anhydrase
MAGLTADEAWEQLVEGNRRYVAGTPLTPFVGPAQRRGLLRGQNPFATILACSDSRTPPELVFDQGMGRLFVVRVAGNITSPDVSGSIEFAVDQLGVHLCVVLGHQDCGAVAATMAGRTGRGDIRTILETIRPAVEAVSGSADDRLRQATHEHARRTARALAADEPVLASAARGGRLTIVPAYHDLESGVVTRLDG